MTDLSRRRLLTAAAAASLLPPSVHTALAEPAPPGGLDAIEHVVILMQENRSFDNYFGTLRGVRGFSDKSALRRIFSQSGVMPFSARKAAERGGRPGSDIQYLGSLDHSWEGGQAAWANGWNNGWVPAKTPSTMAYYDRADIPFQYELAETFTLCDAYHCSVFGPTNPNRLYMWSGNVGYEPGTDRRVVGNDAYAEDTHPGYTWTTYPERLESRGVSWTASTPNCSRHPKPRRRKCSGNSLLVCRAFPQPSDLCIHAASPGSGPANSLRPSERTFQRASCPRSPTWCLRPRTPSTRQLPHQLPALA
jgi:phospholipase C